MYTIRHLHKKKGFTIVELVVVMAVKGGLFPQLLPFLLGGMRRADIGSAQNTPPGIKQTMGAFF